MKKIPNLYDAFIFIIYRFVYNVNPDNKDKETSMSYVIALLSLWIVIAFINPIVSHGRHKSMKIESFIIYFLVIAGPQIMYVFVSSKGINKKFEIYSEKQIRQMNFWVKIFILCVVLAGILNLTGAIKLWW
jgi:uncharacterized membrane protein